MCQVFIFINNHSRIDPGIALFYLPVNEIKDLSCLVKVIRRHLRRLVLMKNLAATYPLDLVHNWSSIHMMAILAHVILLPVRHELRMDQIWEWANWIDDR